MHNYSTNFDILNKVVKTGSRMISQESLERFLITTETTGFVLRLHSFEIGIEFGFSND